MKIINTLRTLALAAIAALTIITVKAGDQVPAKTSTSGIVHKTNIANPAAVPLGTPFVLLDVEAEGIGSHLGKYTIEITGSAWLAMVNGKLTAVSSGEWVATTASGDTLYGEWTNYEVVGQVGTRKFTGTSVTLGGTGRFEGATGAEGTVGTLNPIDATTDALFYMHDGWISTVGSSKRNN